MLPVLTWYLALQLFAFAAWPMVFAVCHRLPDRGYGAAKGLGLLLVTYITWALAHLAHKVPVLGFSFGTVSAAWAAVLLVSVACMARRGGEMWQFVRRRSGYILTIEAVMVAAFALMVALRATVPHISFFVANPLPDSIIDHAAEKFMDFAVVNSLLTSHAFPPHDPWVSGLTLNYYYFGHMMWAVLIKFCSVRPEIGFNLALAAAFSLASALSFSLGYNLTHRRRWGFLMVFLVVLMSNLDGFLQFVGALRLTLLPGDERTAWMTGGLPWWRHYDFWRSSRAIANTINEFPAFSFLLGDLHAHVSALVLNFCGWNLAVQVFRSARLYRSLWRYEINGADELFLAAIVVGALSATNSWDVPVFTGVIALALWSGNTGRHNPYEYQPAWLRAITRAGNAAEAFIVAAVVTIFGVGLLFYPFAWNFQTPLPETGELIKMVSPENRSDPFEFFTHWFLLAVFPLAAAVWFFAGSLRRHRRRTVDPNGRIKTIALVCVLGAAGLVLLPLAQGWVAILTGAGVVLLASLLVAQHLPSQARWLCGLLMLFCAVTCFCEVFYVDDIFDGPIERINTVFKAYYGLWPLMAVATVLALRLLIERPSTISRRWRAVWMIAPLVLAGSPYMILGTIHRITSTTRLGQWTPPEDAPHSAPPAAFMLPQARAKSLSEALDGMRYLQFTQPDDYAAMIWIRAHLPGDAIILEAAGTQYSYAGRISAMTGRPAFAGWLNHAWGWRGHAFMDERTRRLDVAAEIYQDADPADTLRLLKAEHISYVIVGDLEREQYPGLDESVFDDIGQKVFSHGRTAIYRIP